VEVFRHAYAVPEVSSHTAAAPRHRPAGAGSRPGGRRFGTAGTADPQQPARSGHRRGEHHRNPDGQPVQRRPGHLGDIQLLDPRGDRQAAGITWRVYQEYDNYDDNALAWFKQYANAPASSPLYQNAMIKRPAGWFEHDARNDRLPQVSWLVAPSAQCEHPNWMPAAGAEYIASKLEAIASNPDVWAKTLFILTYDENDGYFDHVPPPTPPAGTADELVDGVAIGAGFRVPTIMVSPWTAGGYVYSEALDHTSLIQLLEQIFGVTEPNISAWRRQTFGNMTGALNLNATVAPYPDTAALGVAAAAASLVTAQQEVAANPAPTVPTGTQTMPTQ
jgi:phospholipase C